MADLRPLKRVASRYLRRPARAADVSLPAPVVAERSAPLLDYYRDRLVQHTEDVYCGTPIQKFPEDLRVYEHLLWAGRSNVVVELGCNAGGSTLWFRDRLATMAHYRRIGAPRVIAVDIVIDLAEAGARRVDPDARGITFVQGDVLDPDLPDRIRSMLRPGDRPFVIEDTAHQYDTTMAALDGFWDLVPLGCWFVVEDTVVDEDPLRIDDRWPRGVAPAVAEWLATGPGQQFEIDRSIETYGVTCHPGGFLRRHSMT